MLTADQSSLGMQAKIQDFLCQDEKAPLHSQILRILSSFEFTSANGQHTCLVFELAGPNLDSTLKYRKIRTEIARKPSGDIVHVIKYLHENSIAFGDLSTANILLRLKDLSQDDKEMVIERFGGEAYVCQLDVLEGKNPYRQHGPENQYGSHDSRDLDLDLILPEIVLTDLNEAVLVDAQATDATNLEDSAVHTDITAPEYIFSLNRIHSKESDIWSLACGFFEIRTCKPLIASSDIISVGSDMVELLGPLPRSWIDLIKRSPQH